MNRDGASISQPNASWPQHQYWITYCLLMLSIGAVASGCRTLSSRPFYVQVVRLSSLHQTTVVFDTNRYSGINLIITNDLGSDVFLKFEPQDGFESYPQHTQNPFRMPDSDERYRGYREAGHHPLIVADVFMYIWSGNTGWYHIIHPVLSPEKDYFLPITYYQCKDAGFSTKSLKIVAGNAAVSGKSH